MNYGLFARLGLQALGIKENANTVTQKNDNYPPKLGKSENVKCSGEDRSIPKRIDRVSDFERTVQEPSQVTACIRSET